MKHRFKKGKKMKRKTLINLKGEKETVLPKDIFAKLQAGYKVPNKVAYLYNSAGNLKKIMLVNNPEGQKKVIGLLKQGYSFDPNIVKKPIDQVEQLTSKIEYLEKKLKEKEDEFEVFKRLSQINIERNKKLQEKEIFNVVTKHLLEIIANNPLEEIILNHKEDKYSFSGVVKIKK
jgi:hypothetical protein